MCGAQNFGNKSFSLNADYGFPHKSYYDFTEKYEKRTKYTYSQQKER